MNPKVYSLVERMSEPSTYNAIGSACLALGVTIPNWSAVSVALAGAAHAIAAFMPDPANKAAPAIAADPAAVAPGGSLISRVAALFLPAAIAGAVLLGGCSGSGTPSLSPASLTPTQATIAQIGCAVDGIAQPIALPVVAGVPTVGGIAATVDAALVHPLVVAECAKLNATPVAMAAAAAAPTVTK